MPLELQIELRANRGGTVLPDTHGQVWTELCAWAEQDGNGVMFGGARRDVEEQLSRALKFNTREQFPGQTSCNPVEERSLEDFRDSTLRPEGG